jgi:uncharacterized membrane protein
MADHLLFVVTLLGALGCGLIAGVFFAFSTFIMKALDRIMPSQGIAAMQSINIVVLNPWFLGVFLGTAVDCVVALLLSVYHWDKPGAVYVVAGAVLYLVGTFYVTVVFNVPKNNALASVKLGQPRATDTWTAYVSSWTKWNHVRTAASFAAMLAFILSLAR